MGIYNACNNGQGCTGGCNLTAYSWFGAMCNGTSNNGNCFGATASGGQQTMQTSFSLPPGCTANFTTEFIKRGGSCPNSGMDGGDLLGVNSLASYGTNLYTCTGGNDNGTINPSGCTGTSNADVSISGMQTGGVIMFWGSSNRSDEIITFTINLSGTCGTNCNAVLPITLKDFYAQPNSSDIDIRWYIEKENNVDYYVVERSSDALNFELLNKVASISKSAGNYNLNYSLRDYFPLVGLNYYRLSEVDKSGSVQKSKIITINFIPNANNTIWINQSDEKIIVNFSSAFAGKKVNILNTNAAIQKKFILPSDGQLFLEIDKLTLGNGLFVLCSEEGVFNAIKFLIN
ncbi:MAG: hypothetical protein JSU07_05320 [Bacteroidetes bacterium]|nr:hypothetical protein [Bacteroidota bacterium]